MDTIEIVTAETLVPIRKRAFRNKSSTGCMTCRIRRIKCDELRPACTQCKRGKRICDGYAAAKSISRQTPKIPPPCSYQVEDNRIQPSPSILSTLFASPIEGRYFNFFIRKTVPGLSGPFKSEFWIRMVLQATHHEFAIRHAIVAIGALHEAFEQSRKPGKDLMWQDNSFALQYYLKAIQCLVTPVGGEKREGSGNVADVALITCILFVCFEVLRGYHGAALSHIEGGIRLFKQIQNTARKASSNDLAPIDVFKNIFARLDNQASSITHDRRRNLLSTSFSLPEIELLAPIVLLSSTPFVNMDDARFALEKIQNAVVRASSSVIDPTLLVDYANSGYFQMGIGPERESSKLRLEQWSRMLNSFVQAQKHVFTVSDWKALEILQIMSTVMTINFNIDFVAVTKNELLWDAHLAEFMKIVEHARKFVQLGEGEGNVPTLTLEIEIILPLYFVAAKCRDGRLRREAIALLRTRERQEGVWNSSLTAMLAARLLQMEEEGMAHMKTITDDGEVWDGFLRMEDIKWENRVQGVQVKWEIERRRVKLTYQRENVEHGGQGVVNVRAMVPI